MTEYSDYDACSTCGGNHGGALCPEIKCDCYPERNCEYCTTLCESCGERTMNELLVEGQCPKCLGDHHSSKCNFSLPDRESEELEECTECGRYCAGNLPPCRHRGTACKRCDTAINNDIGYCNKCMKIMTSGCCENCGHEISSSDISCGHCGARGEG